LKLLENFWGRMYTWISVLFATFLLVGKSVSPNATISSETETGGKPEKTPKLTRTPRIDMSKKSQNSGVNTEVYTFVEITKNIYGQEIEFIEEFEEADEPELADDIEWWRYQGL